MENKTFCFKIIQEYVSLQLRFNFVPGDCENKSPFTGPFSLKPSVPKYVQKTLEK